MGLATVLRRLFGRDYHYQKLTAASAPSFNDASAYDRGDGGSRRLSGTATESSRPGSSSVWARSNRSVLKLSAIVVSLLVVLYLWMAFSRASAVHQEGPCDSVKHGYQCHLSIAQYWGQYAPFFSVPAETVDNVLDGPSGQPGGQPGGSHLGTPGADGSTPVDNTTGLPPQCHYTFAQVLSRHGGRGPTAGRSIAYAALIQRIQDSAADQRFVDGPDGNFAFLNDYTYHMPADELTSFGERQMVNSGGHFFLRYRTLVATLAASSSTVVMPFVRSAGQHRVVVSAIDWIQGFHRARSVDPATMRGASPAMPEQPLVVIPEEAGFNNTLSYNGLCRAFTGRAGVEAQNTFAATFVPAITARLNRGLPGAAISDVDTIALMDLCPFETIADGSASGSKKNMDRQRLSGFCALFSTDEWRSYDYFQTLGKWYGYGEGSALGATQGAGFVNELVARLTGKPVDDHTSTNRTLDADPATFPLDATLYADFSHDNDMSNVFAALGLFNGTAPLQPSNTTRVEPEDLRGFAASWTVPFAARMYVEKMRCVDAEEELVRVLVNDRVVPLAHCGADALGRCTLSNFVDSLAFARNGGRWDECFVGSAVSMTGSLDDS